MRTSRLAIICVLAAALFSGCIFSPKKGKGGGTILPPTYLAPIRPEFVLLNLRSAYIHRDSTAYKSLFDPLYRGTSIDRTDPSSDLDTLTWADEAQHIAALARSTATVDLHLVSVLIRSSDAGDPPGWALIQNPIADLAIYEGANGYVLPAGDETIEFRFIPKTPDSTSPTDTTWKIIRWLEVR